MHTTAVDAVAEDDRDADADDRAQCRRQRVVACVECSHQEDGGLQSLTQHGQERHHHECNGGALVHCVGGRSLQVTLEIAGVFAHPHDHVGHHHDGDGADDCFEALLLALREVAGQHLEADGHSHADRDRHADADPHPPQGVGASLASQECRDDAHDERRLEAFPKADDEGREHSDSPDCLKCTFWLVSPALPYMSQLRLRSAMRDHQGTNGTMVNR